MDPPKSLLPGTLEPDPASRSRGLLEMGYRAEKAGEYLEARELYERSVALQPRNPVTRRFLGELWRFYLGEWDEAEVEYRAILELTADESDPLSRAVAYQGLGKIALWRGETQLGLGHLEESMSLHPTPLCARHLADYWHGKGELNRAYAYADQALELAPEDPYNRVFYAAFLALKGEEERSRAWLEEIPVEPGQAYNRACSHVLWGEREKALELLRTHFFEFETQHKVRALEMRVARKDPFFASLAQDSSFLALTEFTTSALD